LADAHLAALTYLKAQTGHHVWNIGVGKGYSVLDIVSSFERENNVKIPYELMPRRSGDVETCYADASKAKNELGWTAQYGINEMVRDSWNWQKQNPKGYEAT